LPPALRVACKPVRLLLRAGSLILLRHNAFTSANGSRQRLNRFLTARFQPEIARSFLILLPRLACSFFRFLRVFDLIWITKIRIMRCENLNDAAERSMTLYQGMLIFYAVVALVATLITFFIAKDKLSIKLLSAFLVGATWPMSFPVALMFALF